MDVFKPTNMEKLKVNCNFAGARTSSRLATRLQYFAMVQKLIKHLVLSFFLSVYLSVSLVLSFFLCSPTCFFIIHFRFPLSLELNYAILSYLTPVHIDEWKFPIASKHFHFCLKSLRKCRRWRKFVPLRPRVVIHLDDVTRRWSCSKLYWIAQSKKY